MRSTFPVCLEEDASGNKKFGSVKAHANAALLSVSAWVGICMAAGIRHWKWYPWRTIFPLNIPNCKETKCYLSRNVLRSKMEITCVFCVVLQYSDQKFIKRSPSTNKIYNNTITHCVTIILLNCIIPNVPKQKMLSLEKWYVQQDGCVVCLLHCVAILVNVTFWNQRMSLDELMVLIHTQANVEGDT